MRARLAPIASRTAISRWRAAERASSKFATFAQAIRSSRPTTVINTIRGCRNRLRRSIHPVRQGELKRLW
jgi:hypothetical protein